MMVSLLYSVISSLLSNAYRVSMRTAVRRRVDIRFITSFTERSSRQEDRLDRAK